MKCSGGSRTSNKGGGGLSFTALRASVWSKNKGEGGGASLPGPSPGSATVNFLKSAMTSP